MTDSINSRIMKCRVIDIIHRLSKYPALTKGTVNCSTFEGIPVTSYSAKIKGGHSK